MTAASELVDVFADAGLACADNDVLPEAARALAARLIAAGHSEALAALTAEVWMANDARKALADRWAAHGAAWRAAFVPGDKEPPGPPDQPTTPPPPPTEEPPPPPSDITDPSARRLSPPAPGEGQ